MTLVLLWAAATISASQSSCRKSSIFFSASEKLDSRSELESVQQKMVTLKELLKSESRVSSYQKEVEQLQQETLPLSEELGEIAQQLIWRRK